MDDIRKGKVYALVFVIFLGILGGGGFYITKKFTKIEPKREMQISEPMPQEINLKIIKDEDYFYFTDEEIISSKHEIAFKNIHININSIDARRIEEELNKLNDSLKKNLVKISDKDLTTVEKNNIIYNEEDIYNVSYIKYSSYVYKNYASILAESYEYDCIKGKKQIGSNSYVFDTKTGDLITKEAILAKFNLTLDSLKEKVKKELEQETIITIDIEETLNLLDNPEEYALYINKSGHLVLNYLVKNAETDYNDVIVLN